MQKVNVSVVSYSNSAPFVFGLRNSEIIDDINLSLDFPSACADKLLSGIADIGLIPIVEVLRMKDYKIISDLCIGANDYVKTVILASNTPVEQLSDIYLDYQSRTSVVLAKILAKHHWKIAPNWISSKVGFEKSFPINGSATVIIGDRSFGVEAKYRYDLAHEWKVLTGLPFVFAAWVSNKPIDHLFVAKFNKALHYGIDHIDQSIELFLKSNLAQTDLKDYLTNYINYPLDLHKHQAIDLFLEYAKEVTHP